MTDGQPIFSIVQKTTISIIIGILIYFGLTFIYEPFVVEILKKNDWTISNISDSNINLQIIFFSFVCFTFLILISFNNQKNGKYIKEMIYAISFIILGLILQMILLYFESKMSVPKFVKNELTISYATLFILPTIMLFPNFFKNVIDSFKLNSVSQKYVFFKDIRMDNRLIRILAYLIDMIIIFFISFIFSKIIVILPDTLFMIVLTIIIYFFTLETTFLTTIGKFLFGLEVKNSNDNGNFFRLRVFIRTVIRLVPLYPVFVLFNRKGLHEYLSRTYIAKRNFDNKNNGISQH